MTEPVCFRLEWPCAPGKENIAARKRRNAPRITGIKKAERYRPRGEVISGFEESKVYTN